MMHWFGPAGLVAQGIPRVATPVGQVCAWCDESISSADAGVSIDGQSANGAHVTLHYHEECEARMILGSVEQQRRQQQWANCCECVDDSALSVRQAARVAYQHFSKHRRMR